MPTDFYDVLGVPADASSDELKRAYRSRVREYHPDVNDHQEGDAQFKLIRKANDVLTDPAERKDYDRMGHREYAEKRLDDLPAFSVFPEFEDAGTTDPDEENERTSTATSSAGPTTSSAGRTTAQSSSSTGDSRSRRSDRARQSSAASSASTGTGSTTNDTATSSRNGTTTDRNTESTGSDTTAGAETADSSQWADLSGEAARRNADDSSTPAGVRRRRGLRRWYGVVLLSLFTYVGGVATYLLANRGDALELVAALQTAPVQAVLGAVPLQSPTAYVLTAANTAAAGTPTLGLLLLAGTALLPLVVLTAVAQYGHGSAWAYALASLGPAVTLAAYPFVTLPVAALLVGVVVLPLVSGLGFLVDVGRYLLATR